MLAKRRRARRAVQALARGVAPKGSKPLSSVKATRGAAARVPDMAQDDIQETLSGNAQETLSGDAPETLSGDAQETLSGHAHAASAGPSMASVGVSEAGMADTLPDESSGVLPTGEHEALVADTAQLPSQLPSQLPTQLPSHLPAPQPVTEPIASAPTEPTQVSDHTEIYDLQDMPPEANSNALLTGTDVTPGEQVQAPRDRLLHPQNPSAAAATASLPSNCLPVQTAAASPSQAAKTGAQHVLERTLIDSAQTPGTQVPPMQASKAAGVVDATRKTVTPTTASPMSAPKPETPARESRAAQGHDKSPELEVAAQGLEAATGPRLVACTMHDAYAKSRFTSQNTQQQPHQLLVPNPFKVSPERLTLPSGLVFQQPNSAQNSTQTPPLSRPERAPSRSMSPEALPALQMGVAGQETTTMHSGRLGSHSRSPEVALLSAPVTGTRALPQRPAASPAELDYQSGQQHWLL